MNYSNLGNTDLKVSKLGFGGIPIMSGREVEFLVQLKNVKYEESLKTIRRAYELGINFFDTAISYRDSEKKIGEALRDVRKKIVIASKSHALTRENMLRDIENSLTNLDTDFIDLYQLHYVKDLFSLDKILDKNNGAYLALQEMKEQGVIRYIGIASHNPFVLKPAIETGYFSTVQLPLNFLEHENVHLIDFAKSKRLGTIIMKPFAGGTLTKSSEKIKDLNLSDKDLKRLALKYILEKDIDCVIPGISNIEELNENLQIFSSSNLSNKEQETIKLLTKRLGKVFCRRCQYCEPCPSSINISYILRLSKYYEDYGLKDWARQQYRNLEIKANDCTECHICESKCPYEINIVSELKRIDSLLKK